MISFLTDCGRWSFDYYATCVSAIIAVLAGLYCYSTWTYGKWRKLNVPYVPPVPLFGNMFKTMMKLEHPIDTFGRIYNQFPDAKLCGFYQMRDPMLMVRDPELINAILVKDFSHFTDHGIDLDPSATVLANSLFFVNGQRWRTMRQKLSSGFTSGKLKDTHGQIDECGDRMLSGIVDTLGKTDRLDVQKFAAGFSTDVIGTCAFGLKLDAIDDDCSDFRRYVRMLFRSTVKQTLVQVLMMTCPRVVKLFKLQMFPAEATNFFQSVFSDVIKYRDQHNVVRNDLTHTLMQARNPLVSKENTTAEGTRIGRCTYVLLRLERLKW